MSKTSTMFLNKISVIDHAVLTDYGPLGGSYNLNVAVSGEVDPHENVVVDFSTIKKDIKKLIDDKEHGFDHKLWVWRGEVLGDNVERNIAESKNGESWIITPMTRDGGRIEEPKNAVRFLKPHMSISAQIEQYLEENLRKLYKGVDIRVRVNLDKEENITQVFRDGSIVIPFNYVHGLKNSTSWGCQNILHGHNSFLALNMAAYLPPNDPAYFAVQRVAQRVTSYFDNCMYIWRQNLFLNQRTSNAFTLDVGYETERGTWYLEIPRSMKIRIFDEETTIENLAEFICYHYLMIDPVHDILIDAGVDSIYVSEGLSKGALIQM
jgi:6-pyruvoyl-tetrahydropterin synthase